MRDLNTISQDLFDKLRNQFSQVYLRDKATAETSDPKTARFFTFNFAVGSNKYGNITVSVADGKSVRVNFTRNLSAKMPAVDRKQWYAFLKDMRFFALKNSLTFNPQDITRDQLTTRDLANTVTEPTVYSASEVSETRMYGSARRSYERFGPTKILVKHTNKVDPAVRGARSRQIESIFIETADGERFKLPFVSLTGARAMANHVRQGGLIKDSIGNYISNVVAEMNSMRGFVRNARNSKLTESAAAAVVSAAIDYYGELHEQLHQLKGSRTYKHVTQSFRPVSDFSSTANMSTVTEYFAGTALEESASAAHPALQRAVARHARVQETAVGLEFEQWANDVVESLGDLSDSDITRLTELFSAPIAFGAGASNVISLFSDLIDSDDLNTSLVDSLSDPEITEQSDARAIVHSWLVANEPSIADKIEFTDEPADAAEPEQTAETVDRYDFQKSFISDVEVKEPNKPLARLSKLAGIK